jgi:hypothetical protein
MYDLQRAASLAHQAGQLDRATINRPLATVAVREALQSVGGTGEEHEIATLRVAYLTGFGDMELLRVAVRRAEALKAAS